jgi:E3 ubiquitin-protein ligase SHPRH
MATLMKDAAAKGLTKESMLIQTPYCDKGGIRSSELVCRSRNVCVTELISCAIQMEEANEILEGLLNEQSALLWEVRSQR